MASRPIWCLVAVGTAAVLAAACSSPSPARGNAVSTGWARTDLKPVTQPAPVAGRFVLYVSSGQQISVLGLNAHTGATVWSDAATPSIMAPGIVPELAVVGGVVVYLHPLGGQTADLVGADAATGRTIWHSGAGRFTDWPQVCPGSAVDVCVTGSLPGIDTGLASNLDRVGRTGLFVGSVGFAPVSVGPAQARFDLSRSMTVGFRIADGSVVWRDSGSSYACNFGPLPCPGADLASYSSAGSAAGPVVGLRLRSTGTMTVVRRDSLRPLASPDEHTVIEGFAPATGRTLWTFDAGHDPRLLGLAVPPAQVAAYTVILTAPDGRLVALNLANGSTRPVPGAAIVWCRSLVTYSTNNQEYLGQYGMFPCDAQQQPVPTPQRAPSFVGAIGASADGLIAWSESSAVVAATQSG
jgi:outer membrane protein assembly factor BamB